MKAARQTYTSRAKEALQHLPGLRSIVSIRPNQILSLLILDRRLHHAVVVSVGRAAEALAVAAMAQNGALVMALDGEVDAFAEARTVDCRFAHVERCDLCDGLDGTIRVECRRKGYGIHHHHHHRPEPPPRGLPRPRLATLERRRKRVKSLLS